MSATHTFQPMDRPVGKWAIVRGHVNGGHAVFRDEAGRIAIADNSGRFPENTDDGILWVDTGHVIETDHARGCRVSVRDPKGAEFGTVVTTADALWFATTFDMVIQTPSGRRYKAAEFSPSGRPVVNQ
jgi:hypothetical protein